MNNKSIRRITAVLLVTILLLSIVGCKSIPPVVENEVDKIDTVAKDDKAVESNEPIVIVDHLDRIVEFDKPAERIVSGYYITTAMLLSLGLRDKIVGIEAKAEARPIYKIAAPELLKLPLVGNIKELDLEGLIALNPDLVILPVRLKDSVESIEKLGIKVITVNPESMEQLNEALTMIGKATGHEVNANKLIEYSDKKIKIVKDLVKDKEMKNIYLGGNSSFLSTASNKMYQHTLIETAGGINVAEDIDDTYWANISYEQLISYDPDIIIGIPGASYSKDEIMNDNKLKGIKAIKNDEVYFMPPNFESWDSPIPSAVLGVLWLTSVLHEDLYSFEEFKEDVFLFYKEFYGVEINKDDITK